MVEPSNVGSPWPCHPAAQHCWGVRPVAMVTSTSGQTHSPRQIHSPRDTQSKLEWGNPALPLSL